MNAKPVVYTTQSAGLPKGGHRYANPHYFDAVKEDAPKVFVVGRYPEIVAAYRQRGIPVEVVATNEAALGHLPVAPILATDPAAPLTTGKGPGGRWYVKRGKEIVTGPFKTEAEAAKAARR